MKLGRFGFKKAAGFVPGPTGTSGNVYMTAGASVVLARPTGARDSAGNWFGVHTYGSNAGIDVRRVTYAGTIWWARKLTAAATTVATGISIVNPLVRLYIGGTLTDQMLWACYNESGDIQWRKKLDLGGPASYNNGCFADYVGGAVKFVAGGYGVGSPSYAVIACLDDNGAFLFKKRLTAAHATQVRDVFQAPQYGASQFGFAYQANHDGTQHPIIGVMDYTGAVLWRHRLQHANITQEVKGALTIDGDAVCAYQYVSTVARINVVKVTSAGVIKWQRQLYWASNGALLLDVATDANRNTYVLWSHNGATPYVVITKIDDTGAIVWNHKISHASYTVGLSGSLLYDVDYGNIFLSAQLNKTPMAAIHVSLPSGAGLTAGNKNARR